MNKFVERMKNIKADSNGTCLEDLRRVEAILAGRLESLAGFEEYYFYRSIFCGEISEIKKTYVEVINSLNEILEHLQFLEKKGIHTIMTPEEYEEYVDLENIKKEEERIEKENNKLNTRISIRRTKASEKNKNFFEKKNEKRSARERREYTFKPKTVAFLKRERRRADRRAANKFAIEEVA